MSYTERNGSKIKRFGRCPIWKYFFCNQFCQSRWAILSEMLQKSNCLTEPAFEKASFSNPFSQSRWGVLSETHLKKTAFSNPFYQSRWAILSETVQRSNGLADGSSEKASFLITFVNRDEIYWGKRFKNQTVWQNPHLTKAPFSNVFWRISPSITHATIHEKHVRIFQI